MSKFCPILKKECIGEECMSYSNSVVLTVMDTSNMLSHITNKDIDLVLEQPLVLKVKVSLCKHFDILLDEDDKELMSELTSLISGNLE